jgi:hypothetical protein
MRNKFENRNSKIETRFVFADAVPESRGGFFEFPNFSFLRRFRLPRRMRSQVEEMAARNRAERLFAVNFRSWTR